MVVLLVSVFEPLQSERLPFKILRALQERDKK